MDGSARNIKTLGWSHPSKLCLSPDGRWIVYDSPQKEGAPERDIFLVSADGSREMPLVKHPADDLVLGWTPDGKKVLFASDRTGATMSVWAVEVSDGKPQGSPGGPAQRSIGARPARVDGRLRRGRIRRAGD